MYGQVKNVLEGAGPGEVHLEGQPGRMGRAAWHGGRRPLSACCTLDIDCQCSVVTVCPVR